jgi:dynactin 6
MTIYSRSAAVRPVYRLPTNCMSHLSHFRTNLSFCVLYIGVESPSVGNFNTVSTRARVHHTVRISSYCVIGAGCLVVPTDDEVLDEYTVIYGPSAERRVWSGRGRVQEADLRRKHAEYLRETLPKFNRLRRGDAHGYGA